MPHTTRIKEDTEVVRDQTGSKATLLRYDRINGELVPVLQFPSKVLASGKTKKSAEWKCHGRHKNETPMQRFHLFYSKAE